MWPEGLIKKNVYILRLGELGAAVYQHLIFGKSNHPHSHLFLEALTTAHHHLLLEAFHLAPHL